MTKKRAKRRPAEAPHARQWYGQEGKHRLSHDVGACVSISDLARRLGRSESAIRAQLRRLNIAPLARHPGEVAFRAVTSPAAHAVYCASADAAGETLEHHVGRILAELARAEWTDLRANIVASARGEA